MLPSHLVEPRSDFSQLAQGADCVLHGDRALILHHHSTGCAGFWIEFATPLKWRYFGERRRWVSCLWRTDERLSAARYKMCCKSLVRWTKFIEKSLNNTHAFNQQHATKEHPVRHPTQKAC